MGGSPRQWPASGSAPPPLGPGSLPSPLWLLRGRGWAAAPVHSCCHLQYWGGGMASSTGFAPSCPLPSIFLRPEGSRGSAAGPASPLTSPLLPPAGSLAPIHSVACRWGGVRIEARSQDHSLHPRPCCLRAASPTPTRGAGRDRVQHLALHPSSVPVSLRSWRHATTYWLNAAFAL